VEDGFQFISAHQTSEPQRGIGFIPRRSLDVSQHEIARAFKLTTGSNRIGMIEPLSFRVPRKAEGFLAE
jgi:coronin-1B/1C/6